MVAHGSSGVTSRPGVRPGYDAERLKRLQIAVHNATAYQRRVAAKGAAGGRAACWLEYFKSWDVAGVKAASPS
jgi:hypothetical protein